MFFWCGVFLCVCMIQQVFLTDDSHSDIKYLAVIQGRLYREDCTDKKKTMKLSQVSGQ